MSLGGYKFAGRYCQKGSLTDAQWALLIHKTRIKAFLDASARANAGWQIDHTNGQIDFENYGNAIYRLDDIGYNFITTFKNGDNAFFQIVSLFYWTSSGASAASGSVNPMALLARTNGTTHSRYMGVSLFFRIGTTRNDPSLSASTLNGMSYLYPAGTSNTSTYTTNITTQIGSTSGLFSNYSPLSIGYAVKGKHIISFIKANSHTFISLWSADFYSSVFNDPNPYPSYNYLTFNSSANTSGSYGEAYVDSNYSDSVSSDNNLLVNQVNCPQGFAMNPAATYNPPCQNYPFSAVTSVAWGSGSTLPCVGIGVSNIDLIATNCSNAITPFSVGQIVANGNYYTARRFVSNAGGVFYVDINGFGKGGSYYTTSGYQYSLNCFVGWDPSNPDITQASSWTEYTE